MVIRLMIAKSEIQDRGHFSDLDGVRGLLAITVMLFHYGLNTVLGRVIGIGPPVWDACVDFFFVLSGFVICKSITDRSVSVLHFAKKRVWRLFPLHIAVLILFSPVLFDGGESAINLLLNISAFAPLVLQKMENFPAWSMGFEFYLPIVFVALFFGACPQQTCCLGDHPDPVCCCVSRFLPNFVSEYAILWSIS